MCEQVLKRNTAGQILTKSLIIFNFKKTRHRMDCEWTIMRQKIEKKQEYQNCTCKKSNMENHVSS